MSINWEDDSRQQGKFFLKTYKGEYAGGDCRVARNEAGKWLSYMRIWNKPVDIPLADTEDQAKKMCEAMLERSRS